MTQTTTSATSAPSCHGGLAPDQWEVPKEPPRAICANEASQGAKEVTSKSLEAIYETWGFQKANFPQWKFPLPDFFPLGYIHLCLRKKESWETYGNETHPTFDS